MKKCLQKILCCLKPKKVEQEQEQEQAHDLRMDKDYIPNYVAQRLSLDSKSSYSESYDNSEEMNKKVAIVNDFMQVYKGETSGRDTLDSFNQAITPKRGVEKGKELYLKTVKRQDTIYKMEKLLLKEADKTETQRQKLLEHKSSDLDIIHMSANRALKLKAEDNVQKSIAVATLEDDINAQQRHILQRTQEFKDKERSESIKKTQKILLQINQTEESIVSNANVFDDLIEPRIVQGTTTEMFSGNDELVFLSGSSSDENMELCNE